MCDDKTTFGIYYKCRLCGVVYTATFGGIKPARDGIYHATDAGYTWDYQLGSPPKMISVHDCTNGGYGIADLVGTKPTDNSAEAEED